MSDGAELFEAFGALRAISGPVLSIDEIVTNEQLRDRGFFVTPERGADGLEYPGAPFKMSATIDGVAGTPVNAGDSYLIQVGGNAKNFKPDHY